MKVEIKVLPEAKEPYAVIYASEITPEIRRTAALLETKNSGVVSVMENERIIVLRPDEIYMVRVENEKTVVYTKTKRYDGGKRLYEFEEILSLLTKISNGSPSRIRMVLRISLGITTLPRVCDNWTNTGKPLDQAIFSCSQFLYDRNF